MLRQSTILVVLLLVFAFGVTVDAAQTVHLKLQIDGNDIEGDDPHADYQGWIEVIAYRHTIVAPRDAASGLPTGKRQHLPFTVTKPVDKATPMILQALVNNDSIAVRLEFVRPDPNIPTGGAEEHYYTIELIDAHIAGIRQEMLNNKYPENIPLPVMEHITFTYQNLKRQWDAETIPVVGSDNWDVEIGGLPVSDLNFDNKVNLLDLVIMAQEFLMEGSPF